jgi:phage terminase large subunit
VEDCLAEPGISGRGLLAVCIREVQKTLAQSSKRLIEDKIRSLGVERQFRIFKDKIETPGDGLVIFQGMADHTAESIKSLEGFRRAWIEEAQTFISDDHSRNFDGDAGLLQPSASSSYPPATLRMSPSTGLRIRVIL